MGKKKEFDPVYDPFAPDEEAVQGNAALKREPKEALPDAKPSPSNEDGEQVSFMELPNFVSRKQDIPLAAPVARPKSQTKLKKGRNRPFQFETEEEDHEFDLFVMRLRQQYGFGINMVLLMRAAASALLRAEPQLLKIAAKDAPPQSPEWKNKLAWAEYQEHWNRVIANALASAVPVRKGE